MKVKMYYSDVVSVLEMSKPFNINVTESRILSTDQNLIGIVRDLLIKVAEVWPDGLATPEILAMQLAYNGASIGTGENGAAICLKIPFSDEMLEITGLTKEWITYFEAHDLGEYYSGDLIDVVGNVRFHALHFADQWKLIRKFSRRLHKAIQRVRISDLNYLRGVVHNVFVNQNPMIGVGDEDVTLGFNQTKGLISALQLVVFDKLSVLDYMADICTDTDAVDQTDAYNEIAATIGGYPQPMTIKGKTELHPTEYDEFRAEGGGSGSYEYESALQDKLADQRAEDEYRKRMKGANS